MPNRLYGTATALALGISGAALGWWVGLPAPFLTGSALGVLVAALAGATLHVPVPVREAAFLMIGMSIGGSVSMEALTSAARWPVSFLILTVFLFLALFAVRLMLMKVWRCDPVTAGMAALPGHLSFAVGVTTSLGANVPMVSTVQSLRVALLVFLLPLTVVIFGDGEATPSLAAAAPAVMVPAVLALTAAAALAVGLVFRRLKLPAAFLLSGLLVSAIAHVAGLARGDVPDWILGPTLIVLGAVIGTRFCGISRADLRRYALAGLAVTTVVVTGALAAAALAATVLGLPLPVMIVAYTPGAAEATAAIALALDLDPTFVAAHHVYRLMLLALLSPLLIRTVAPDDARLD